MHKVECGKLATELLERGVITEQCNTTLNCLHAYNGAIQKSSTLRAKLQHLGIEASFRKPRVSNDNAFSESLFGAAKYRPSNPHEGFNSLEVARRWCAQFVYWYNEEHVPNWVIVVQISQLVAYTCTSTFRYVKNNKLLLVGNYHYLSTLQAWWTHLIGKL
jgi:hypothetical protein